MILESVVTTRDRDGVINLAPMGPHFEPDSNQFELRPFGGSKTLANLMDLGCGVLHVTDDVLLVARAAINQLEELPDWVAAEQVDGVILVDACRWYEFRVTYRQTDQARAVLQCEVVATGRGRDFYGFNRGKHAVLEAAILATRVSFLPRTEIEQQFDHLEKIVAKTGGADEIEAFQLLKSHVETSCGLESPRSPSARHAD